MSFIPAKTKFRKCRKPRASKRPATSGSSVEFGVFGLKATSEARINSKHIETARRIISRTTKRQAKMWIRIFPHWSLTRKPADVRMGNGKGNVEEWVALVRPGTVLFELDNVPFELAQEAFTKALYKLPLDGKIVTRKFVKIN